MGYKILFVDDEREYQDFIGEILTHEGYEVVKASNATEGLEIFKTDIFDLVITDLKMGAIDGLQFFSLLRRLDPLVRVIVLTGSNHDNDEIRGLEMMVNDYVKKPVSIEVLLTRIARVLREQQQAGSDKLMSLTENIVVEILPRKVFRNDEAVDLTKKEFDLLVFFLQNRNIVHSREAILHEVWRHYDGFVDLRSVDTHVKKIRAKLHLTSIYSVRGVGYEWVE
ncbi:response regulator transcription factor [Culicoidibacter larvae]|uniref:Response regulator transcription factor n=1 Tax=Culicoidibacter larvae TaxID=2579976 RepID=A0A5R8QAL2_9FIRM|nr:response regulator transcription factor [Culicoidibacter larvae]TLG72689.1 response regulator transcription factor [Culicoidibacter larvae]